MQVNEANLELRVRKINEWLMANPNHPDVPKKEQRRNYYVGKLNEMDEYKLQTIDV